MAHDVTETDEQPPAVDVAGLRALLAVATQGDWQVQDGCSWRRIGTARHDGDVLCPDTYSREDRHPDLTARDGLLYDNLNLIVALKNAAPSLLTAYEQSAAMREAIINTPETADFMAGVPIEATHQRERWGSEHDAGKMPEDWFWLIGYLAQKALRAQNAGDLEKAQHHTISTAAALANWHAALTGADTAMRPGIAA